MKKTFIIPIFSFIIFLVSTFYLFTISDKTQMMGLFAVAIIFFTFSLFSLILAIGKIKFKFSFRWYWIILGIIGIFALTYGMIFLIGNILGANL